MADEKVRMQIRISKASSEKLGEMADRYGVSANSLVSYIVGQWLDTNYDLRDHMRAHVMTKVEEMQQRVLENPLELMKWKEVFETAGMLIEEQEGVPLLPTDQSAAGRTARLHSKDDRD